MKSARLLLVLGGSLVFAAVLGFFVAYGGVRQRVTAPATASDPYGVPMYEVDVFDTVLPYVEVVTETIGSEVTVETRTRDGPCAPPPECFIDDVCHCASSEAGYPWTWYRTGWFGPGGSSSLPCDGHPIVPTPR